MMLDFRKVTDDVPRLVSNLLDRRGVSLLPGQGFGDSARHFASASLTHNVEVLGDAMDRLQRFLNG